MSGVQTVRNSIGAFLGEIHSESGSCRNAYGFDHKYLGNYNVCTDTTYDSNYRIYGEGDCTRALILEHAHKHGRR